MAAEDLFRSILSGLSPQDRNIQFAKPGPYNTQLAPNEQDKFSASGEPITKDYDMAGFFRAVLQGLTQRGANGHYPDIWKTPLHQTFSNESMYAKPNAPHWEGNRLIDETGKLVVDEDAK